MPLTPLEEIVGAALSERRGVGAFNVVHIEQAQAIVAGAESARAPVVAQISQNAVRYHGALEPIAVAAGAIARASGMPVALHLDHATRFDLVVEAVRMGFGSVMFDASALPYAENLAATREAAVYCHEHGVFVEAELGEVGGKDGVHAPGARTDPEDARRFVEATGVDALAVAVGSSHKMLTKVAALDFGLISKLRESVPVPLVLHGSSGVPDGDLARAIDAGMTKINIATHLNTVFTTVVRDHLAAHPDVVDTRKYLGPARDAMADEVSRLLQVLRASGQ